MVLSSNMIHVATLLQVLSMVMGEFHIISPKTTKDFPYEMALFGHPLYGGKLIGSLYALDPALNNTDGCEPFSSMTSDWARDVATTTRFILLERGDCHFVSKVRHAQEAGFAAAIVYDNLENASTSVLPIMLGDSTAADVVIPSIIVTYNDAMSLIQMMQTQNVVAMMSWEVPHSDNLVGYAVYYSSRAFELGSFVDNFQYVIDALHTNAKFTPHFEVYNGSQWGCFRDPSMSIDPDMHSSNCDQLCVHDGQFCTYDPEHDTGSGLDGRDVLHEDFRQYCIYEYATNTAQNVSLFAQYWTLFNKQCNQVNPESFNSTCSMSVLTQALESIAQTIPVASLIDLISHSCFENQTKSIEFFTTELQNRRSVGVATYPRFTVNDLQHFGDITCPLPISLATCSPLQMICTGFQQDSVPSACSESFWSHKCYPPLQVDQCGQCLEPNSTPWDQSCMGCDNVLFSTKTMDICGICGGNGSFDNCGRCLQANDPLRDQSCTDCAGTLYGDAKLDACGICNGHGSFDACGVCLDALDIRRQNYQCHIDNDPDAVRVKMELVGLSKEDFTYPVLFGFQHNLGTLVDINSTFINVKSINNDLTTSQYQNGGGGGGGSVPKCNVYFFIAASNSTVRDQIASQLQTASCQLELAIRMKALLPDLSKLAVQSISMGLIDGVSRSSSSAITWTLIGILAITVMMSAIIIIMKRREDKIRQDVTKLFAKYTPLVSVESEEDSFLENF